MPVPNGEHRLSSASELKSPEVRVDVVLVGVIGGVVPPVGLPHRVDDERDFARLMEGAKEVACSAFGDAIISNVSWVSDGAEPAGVACRSRRTCSAISVPSE
jgi:hypothetical protein